jgi:DNA-binding winged helix-turn-helix (wHTH) protein
MSGEEVNFGRFRFDAARRELSREGVPVRLGSRALDILAVLASAKGEPVTKDELLAQVWPGRRALVRHRRASRSPSSDSADQPRRRRH